MFILYFRVLKNICLFYITGEKNRGYGDYRLKPMTIGNMLSNKVNTQIKIDF